MDLKTILAIYRQPIFRLGHSRITLETLLEFIILVVLVALAAGLSRRVLRQRILSRTYLNLGQQHGIEIPFPQLDLHIYEPVRVAMVEPRRMQTTSQSCFKG